MPTILVCGGRHYGNRAFLFKTLDILLAERGWRPRDVRIITGGATGADSLGIQWAKARGTDWRPYYATWSDLTHPNAIIKRRKGNGSKYDASAGHRRNQTMLDREHPYLVVAFPGGAGTADMIRRAKLANIEVLTPIPKQETKNKSEQPSFFS
jgi:predicted Rossmann-fold nucleotide-binding protein